MNIRHTTLVIALAIAASSCTKSRAELERDYINACIMSGEHSRRVCECAANKAGEELSPESFELLVVTLQGDDERASQLRDRADLVEVMAAGTFMVDGPARCVWEIEGR